MSSKRQKNQDKGIDQYNEHPYLYIRAHHNFILTLLTTLKTITSENKQHFKEINKLSDLYTKTMNDIFSSTQNHEAESLLFKSASMSFQR